MFESGETTWCSAEDIARWWSLCSDEDIAAAERDDPGPGYVEPDPLDLIAREERNQAIALGHQMRAMAAHIDRVVATAGPRRCRTRPDGRRLPHPRRPRAGHRHRRPPAIATDARRRLLLTDPLTRHLLDVGANTYQPRKRLARFLRLRDRRCRWPGCGQPARRCEIDHQIKFRYDGLTIAINTANLCRRHHQVKDMPGWSAIQDPATAAITFTTPHGDRYTTRPPTIDGDTHPVVTVLDADRAEAGIPPF